MTVTKVFSLVVCLCVCFGLTQIVSAQTADVAANKYKVPVYLSDMPGDTAILSIGVHPNATYNIDGPLGFSTGDTVRELEIPPPGPTNFDVRLSTIVSKDSLGNGSLASIHPLRTYVTQNDKWKITFQPESDSGNANPMKLWWPANLGSVGGGSWKLTDALGNVLCDMAAQSSFTMPNSNPNPQSVFIVEGDSLGFLTAASDSLVYTYDNKGKIDKPVSGKPYNSEGTFTITVPHTGYNDVHLEFGMGLLEFLSVNPTPTSFNPALTPDGKVAKLDLVYSSNLDSGSSITFTVLGAKGKALTLKDYWWVPSVLPAKFKATKITGPAATDAYLLLYEPNWYNVVEEVYSQGAGTLGATGIVCGITTPTASLVPKKLTPITRYVYMPKYKDLYSTLYAAGIGTHDGGTNQTLFSNVNGKAVVKPLKDYSPKLGKNPLVAELATLHFNIDMSALSTKTNAGFGGLFYADTAAGSIFNGLTVNAIAAYADSVFSGADSSARILSANLTNLYNTLYKINNVFAGPFDTTSWSASKVRLKSSRLLMDLNPQVLYRKSNSGAAPTINPNWVFKGFAPEQFKLEQNYPNPFNPTTTIQFTMPADGYVTLKVYNILGQEVASIYNHEFMAQGVAQTHFNANNFASGVYFYRFTGETVANGDQAGQTFTQVKKMMLVK